MSRLKARLRNGGRFIILILLIFSTFSYAMFQGGFVSWFIFYTLLPFLVYSFFLAIMPIKMFEVHRKITPSKLQRGDAANVHVRFRNKTWFPLIFMTVREMGFDNHTPQVGNVNQIFFVGWKRELEWTYELRDLQRGKLNFSGLQVTFTDFFGWTIRQKTIQQQQSVVVYPKLSEVKYKPLKMQFEQGGIASPYTKVKDTSLVTGIRDYQSGDKYSWIHWKSFAKNETLRTKEFEDRTTQNILLVVDQTAKKNFDYAVDLAASILNSAVRSRGDISFLSTGAKRKLFPQLRTQDQLEQVMQHLAIIEPVPDQSIEALLAKEMGLFNSASLLLVTGEITEGLKQFFANSAKYSRGIICFVVVAKDADYRKSRLNMPNVTVIPLAAGHYENAFAEVMKA